MVGPVLISAVVPVLVSAAVLLSWVMRVRCQILDTNPEVFFHLQQQRFIELVRGGHVEEALEFAQEELAPRGEENVSHQCLVARHMSQAP